MSALTQLIPFEIHITLSSLSMQQNDALFKLCEQVSAKPLLIELQRGLFTQQAMLSKTIKVKNIEDCLEYSAELLSKISHENFNANRLKIEVPYEFASVFLAKKQSTNNYFEWHAKVNIDKIDKLLTVCLKHGAHLSFNSLKNENNWRYVTLREHSTGEQFLKRVGFFKQQILTDGWTIKKEISEYCVYDSNLELDSGWLSL